MKIIFVHPYWDVWGGAESYMTMLYTEMKKKHDCEIYSIYDAKQPVEGLNYLHKVPQKSMLFGVKFNPIVNKYVKKVSQLLKDKKCDVVVSGNWPATYITEYAIKKYKFKPKKKIYICFEPDNGFHHMKLFGKFPLNENAGLFDKARAVFSKVYLEVGRRKDLNNVREQDTILTLSENVATKALSVFRDIEPIVLTAQDYSNVYNIRSLLFDCVDLSKIHKDKELGENYKLYRLNCGTKKIVLYLGRIENQIKRVDSILDVANILRTEKDILFIIAGTGTYLDKLKERIINEKLDNVKCIGFVPEQELNAVYNACDLFIDRSLDEPSGSLTMVEAMACGKPVIASNSGGHKEIITNNGVLIDETDDCLFASTIRDLLNKKIKYELLSKNAEQYAKEHSKKELIKVFEKCLN